MSHLSKVNGEAQKSPLCPIPPAQVGEQGLFTALMDSLMDRELLCPVLGQAPNLPELPQGQLPLPGSVGFDMQQCSGSAEIPR